MIIGKVNEWAVNPIILSINIITNPKLIIIIM